MQAQIVQDMIKDTLENQGQIPDQYKDIFEEIKRRCSKGNGGSCPAK
jgi:hypothetical protein